MHGIILTTSWRYCGLGYFRAFGKKILNLENIFDYYSFISFYHSLHFLVCRMICCTTFHNCQPNQASFSIYNFEFNWFDILLFRPLKNSFFLLFMNKTLLQSEVTMPSSCNVKRHQLIIGFRVKTIFETESKWQQ